MTTLITRLKHLLSAAWARFQFMLALSYRHFGNQYGLKEEYERAIDAFNRAISHDPDFAQAYLQRGILYWREMDHPRKAIIDLTAAYVLNPSLSEARFNRGVAHQQLREYAEAVADFEAYLKEGDHPHWREYAETMIQELKEWTPNVNGGESQP